MTPTSDLDIDFHGWPLSWGLNFTFTCDFDHLEHQIWECIDKIEKSNILLEMLFSFIWGVGYLWRHKSLSDAQIKMNGIESERRHAALSFDSIKWRAALKKSTQAAIEHDSFFL